MLVVAVAVADVARSLFALDIKFWPVYLFPTNLENSQNSYFLYSASTTTVVPVGVLNRVWVSTGVFAFDWASLVQYE